VDSIDWATGLFEGEGSFYLNRLTKRGKAYAYCCAQVKMADEDIVRRFAEVMGLGSIFFHKRAKPHHKDQWVWRCHGKQDTRAVFQAMKPMLGPRRIEQAEKVLAEGY
jgi:hypothetical protein